jgi:hypothetical protein
MDTNDRDDNVHHDDRPPTSGEEVGEAAGGISGVVAGSVIGSAVGPIGTVIGGIAGAVGGWWAGHAIADAIEGFTPEDDAFYRDHYDRSDSRLADRSYTDVRPAYQLGHLAARNPEYRGRSFDAVESDLRRGWDTKTSTAHGEWDHVKGYARDAYARSAGTTNRTPAEAERLRDEANDAANRDAKAIDDVAGYKPF